MNTNLDTRILELEKTLERNNLRGYALIVDFESLEKTFTTGAKFSTGDVASNSLVIQLLNNKEVIVLDKNDAVYILVKKPTGDIVYLPCDILNGEQGIIITKLDVNSVSESGIYEFDITITNGKDYKMVSPRMSYNTYENIGKVLEDPSGEKVTILDTLIAEVNTAKKFNQEKYDLVLALSAESANLEIVDARNGAKNLGARLNNIDSQLEEKAKQSDLDTANARIDSFTSLAEGSTTGDAELIDGRVGADGVTYANIGGAIRGQINDINNTIYDYIQINLFDYSAITENKICFSNTSRKLSETLDFTNYNNVLSPIIELESGINYNIFSTADNDKITNTFTSTITIFFGDENEYYTRSINLDSGVKLSFKLNSNEKYIRLSIPNRYDNERHFNKYLMLCKDLTPDKYYAFSQKENVNIINLKNEVENINKKLPSHYCKRIIDEGIVCTNLTVTSENDYGKVVQSKDTKFSYVSYRLINIAGGTSRYKIKLPQTVSTFNSITLVLKVSNYSNSQSIANIYLTDGSNFSNSNGTWLNGRYCQHNGYVYIKLTADDITAPDNINYVWLEFTARANQNIEDGSEYGVIVLDSIIFNQKMKPCVLISFDQIWEETFENNYYDIMSNRNLPITLFSDKWENVNSDLLKMANSKRTNYGWELGIYGSFNEDPAYLNNSTDTTLVIEDLNKSINSQENVSFTTPISYACRQGVVSDYLWGAIKHTNIKMIRGYDSRNIGYFDKDCYLICHDDISDNSADDIKSKIDKAILYGSTLGLFTHGIKASTDTTIPSSSVLVDTWKTVCDYLKEKKDSGDIDVLTFSEFYKSCVE